MLLVVAVLIVSFLVGFLVGGRLSGFSGIRVRWWGMALAALAIQVGLLALSSLPRGVVLGPFILSHALLVIFAFANVRLAGFTVILAGIALNLVAIAANVGMPVDRDALRSARGPEGVRELQAEDAGTHHLGRDDDVLIIFTDVIPVPPAKIVVSVGDVLTYLGAGWFVIRAMRGRGQVRPGAHRRSRAGPARSAAG